MNRDRPIPIELHPQGEVDLTTRKEIVRDEDVLSLDLRAGLEQVGGAVGLLLIIALVAMHLIWDPWANKRLRAEQQRQDAERSARRVPNG